MKKNTVAIKMQPGPDCILLLAAQLLGFFKKHKVDVDLQVALGLKSIKDALLSEEVDLALFDASMAMEFVKKNKEYVCGWPIQGARNQIFLSEQAISKGVIDEESMLFALKHGYFDKKMSIGVPNLMSSEYSFFKNILRSANITNPKIDIIAMPSHLMATNLDKNYFDLCCLTAPWVQHCLRVSKGMAVESSVKDGKHVANVLTVNVQFVKRFGDLFLSIIDALIETNQFLLTCDAEKVIVDMRSAFPSFMNFSVSVELIDFSFREKNFILCNQAGYKELFESWCSSHQFFPKKVQSRLGNIVSQLCVEKRESA